MKLDWSSCFKVGISIFLLYLCISYWPSAMNLVVMLIGAAAPLLIGCVIAYLVNILMSFYEKFYFTKTKQKVLIKSRRPVCMILAFVTLVAIVYFVIRLLVPQLLSCVKVILSELPVFINRVINWVEKNDLLQEEMLQEKILEPLAEVDWKSKIGQIVQVLTSGIGNAVDIAIKLVSSVFSGLVTALLSTIFAIYLLLGKETLGNQFDLLAQRYLKEKIYKNLMYVLRVVNDCFHKYIVGQCIEAVILGILCMLGMKLLQLPYATMVGTLVAFTALIPVAGAYIGAGVGAFMIITVSPEKVIVFLVFIVVLQQLEGNIIYPKVVGSSMSLPAIWVLTAVTVGGGVMGIPGMLVGVPIMATIYRLIRDDVKNNLKDKAVGGIGGEDATMEKSVEIQTTKETHNPKS